MRNIAGGALAVLLGCRLISGLPCSAQSRWTGAAGTGWTNAGSWQDGAIPAAGSNVLFDAAATLNLGTVLGQDFGVESIAVSNPAGAVSISSNILTVGAGGIDLSAAAQNLTIGAALMVSTSQSWQVQTGRTLVVSGPVTNSATVTKNGAGGLTLSGTVSNGTLVANAGTLTLGLNGGFVAERLTINTNATAVNSTYHVFGGVGAGTQYTRVHVNGGTLTQGLEYYLSNFEMTEGLVSGNDFRCNTGGGTTTVHAAATPARITAAMRIYQGGTYTFQIEDGAADPDLLYARSGGLGANFGGGTTHLEKKGPGTMEISSDNNPLTGNIYPREGMLRLSTNTALANAVVSLAGGDTGTLAFSGGTNFTLGGLVGVRELALTNSSGAAVTLAVGYSNGNFVYGGALTGPGALCKVGTGTLTLISSNSYSGGTFINGGVLAISNAYALGTGPITYAGGLLRYEDPALLPTTPHSIDLPYATAVAAAFAADQVFIDLFKTDAAGVIGLGASTSNALDFTAFTNGVSLGAAGSVTNSGDLTPFGSAYRFGGGNGTLTVSSLLTGEAGLLLSQNGTAGGAVRLTNGANSYSGGTTIRDGTLQLDNVGAAGRGGILLGDSMTGEKAVTFTVAHDASFTNLIHVTTNGSGTVAINGVNGGGHLLMFAGPILLERPTLWAGSSTDRWGISGKISGTPGLLTFGSTGRVTLDSSQNDFVGSILVNAGCTLQMNAANCIPDSSSVTVNGAFYLNVGGGNLEIIGALGGSGAVQLHPGVGGVQALVVGASNLNGSYSGAMGNGGGTFVLRKTGTGTQTLSGTSTFTGGTTLSQGALELRSVSAAGKGAVTLGDSGTGTNDIMLTCGAGGISNVIVVTTNGTGRVTVYADAKWQSLATTVTVDRATTFRVFDAGGADWWYSFGCIAGNGSPISFAAGSTPNQTRNAIGGTNFFTGDVVAQQGRLQINSVTAIPATNNLTVNSGADIRLWIGPLIVNRLEGSGNLYSDNAVQALTIGAAGGSATYGGAIQGNIAVTKAGAGTQTLTGTSTHTGGTTVSGGTLLVNGPLAGTVSVGGTLGGTGSVSGVVSMSSGATLKPGDGGGTLRLSGGLSLADGATLEFGLGTNACQARITGGTLTGASAGGVTVRVTNIGGATAGTPYVLMDWSGATANGVELADFRLDDHTGMAGVLNVEDTTLRFLRATGAVLLLR